MPQEAASSGEAETVRRQELKIKLTDEVIDRVDAWRAQQADKPSREEAVERLLLAHFWPNL